MVLLVIIGLSHKKSNYILKKSDEHDFNVETR